MKKAAKQSVKHPGIMRSAREAMVFALNYSDQQYALSPMAMFLKHEHAGSGRGLKGLDGAGQSGMVWAEITQLEYYQALALIARCTQHRFRCRCGSPCCSGWRPNEIWKEVTSQLCDYAVTALGGELSNRRVRLASTEKAFGAKLMLATTERVFGAKTTLDDVADHASVSRTTAARQHAKVLDCLRTLEHKGWEKLTAALEEKGMLIDANEVTTA